MAPDTTARSLLNALVVDEDGHRWGERATDIQREDADALLSLDGPRRHWLGRSRGYSKTDDLAAVTVAVLLEQMRAGEEAVAIAADRDQAGILVRRMGHISRRTPELGSALQVDRYMVTSAHGVRLEAMASDAAGSWGRTPTWTVADELGQWSRSASARELWISASTAAVKVPHGRLAVISTAGEPDHWSRGVYEHACREDAWRVSEVHGPAPWLDPKDIEAERRRLPESVFARLWENKWASSEDTLLRFEDVQACACLEGALDPHPGVEYVVGVDLALRHDRAVVAVCHAEPLPGSDEEIRVVVDSVDVFRPSRDRDIDLGRVEDTVLVRARTYNDATAIFDPAMAFQMVQRLRGEGLHVIEHTFTATTNSRRALVILELVRSRRLLLPEDDELVQEFASVRMRQLGPGVFRYDHDPGRHDDRVTAVGLGAVHLLDRPTMSTSAPWGGHRGRSRHLLPRLIAAPPRSVQSVAQAAGHPDDPERYPDEQATVFRF